MKPVFSVIIPLFNREKLVVDTINSILAQTETNWEAIIVDDGSTDHSCEVVRKYAEHNPKIILLQRSDNRPKGPSACRNIGYEKARGDFIFYLDSDDLLEKHFFENAARTFKEDPKLDFLGVQCIYFSKSVEELLKHNYPIEFHDDDIRTHYLEKTLWVQTESFCWRKSFLDRYPIHWPEDQRVGEDRVCYYRILTQPCIGSWSRSRVQVYHRCGNSDGSQNDQLTPQVNRNPHFAAERVLTAKRLFDAFNNSQVFSSASEKLLLNNALNTLRGVLSYHHTNIAKDSFQQIVTFAQQINRPDYIRKAKYYMRFAWIFRLHRISFVEKSYQAIRRFLTRSER